MKQNGIFVTGTDTGVGKTYIGQHLVYALLQQAICVRVRKPVESGWSSCSSVVKTMDAVLLTKAAGYRDDLEVVCPNPLQATVSPARAAELEGKTLLISTLKQQCFAGLEENDFLFVEGAGGFYSPLASDGLNADLAQQLRLPVLLVAEDKIGCINQVLLNLEALANRGLKVLAIILNHRNSINDCALDNAEELSAYTTLPIFSYRYEQVIFPQALLNLIVENIES